MSWYYFKPYVSVAERRRKAAKKMEALRKKGVDIQPVTIEGRKIARTFWGENWCHHLESFSDFANRLPRGRTYVRNGSVCHLAIDKGQVEAKVSGSELYTVKIQIKPLNPKKWKEIKSRCAGQIGSLLELLDGRLSDNIMSVVTDRQNGLFPLPGEISLNCSCPDWASMCKHVAAVMYGIGARLDHQPELLFRLRGVDHEELIDTDAATAVDMTGSDSQTARLDNGELADIFGIDIATEAATNAATARKGKRSRKNGVVAALETKPARAASATKRARAASAKNVRKATTSKKSAGKSATLKQVATKAAKQRHAAKKKVKRPK